MAETKSEETRAAAPVLPPRRFESRHAGVFGGRPVDYRAVAAETHLHDPEGKPRASVFSTSYLMEGVGDPSGRPVTFVFNGGPGSSSMWLHMGTFGPRRVVVPSDARSAGAPPFPVADNAHAPLDATDLVFVDPVGTGWSRPLGEAKLEDFWGVDQDAGVLVEFVEAWLTEHRRWNSPRYLAGESYGTTRVVAMAGKMHGDFKGVGLTGLILISAVLDFHTVRFNPGNVLPEIAYLPTYAATALHHGVLRAQDQDAFLRDAREYARTAYAAALLSGAADDPAAARAEAERMARFVGLDPAFLVRSRLRVDPPRFRKELLRGRGLTVGRLDARYVGRDPDDAGDAPEADASSYAIDTAYVAGANDHFGRTLGVSMDRPYVGFNRDALGKWDWLGKPQLGGGLMRVWPTSVNVAPTLARVVREQPGVRVLVANGLYDLATPFFACELSLATNGVDRSRVRMTYYEAGHMMYVHEPSLDAFAADVRGVYA
jgi:carboxypeptidase C (cathepsin A)